MWSKTTYEFAKRWFINGKEVSPFPVKGLFESAKYYHTLQNLIETADRKGYPFYGPEGPNRELVKEIWRILGKPQQAERLAKKYLVFDRLVRKDYAGLESLLRELWPCEEDPDRPPIQEFLRGSLVYSRFQDIFKMQEFYNSELEALKKGHVVKKYESPTPGEGSAAPAYEYADV